MAVVDIPLVSGFAPKNALPNRHGKEFLKEEVEFMQEMPVNMVPVLSPRFDRDGYMRQEHGYSEAMIDYPVETGKPLHAYYNTKRAALVIACQQRNAQIKLDAGTGKPKFSSMISASPAPNVPLIRGAYSYNSDVFVYHGAYAWIVPYSGGNNEIITGTNGAIDVTWADGYYVFVSSGNIFHTELTNEHAVVPLGYADGEFSPDSNTGIERLTDGRIALFGTSTTQIFVNKGNPIGFAFSPVKSATVPYGCQHASAKAKVDGRIFFVGAGAGQSFGVYELLGGTARKVSSYVVDLYLNNTGINSNNRHFIMTSRVAPGERALYLTIGAEDDYSPAFPSVLRLDIDNLDAAGPDMAWTAVVGAGDAEKLVDTVGAFHGATGEFYYVAYSGDETLKRLKGYRIDRQHVGFFDRKLEWSITTPIIPAEDITISELSVLCTPGIDQGVAKVLLQVRRDGGKWSDGVVMDYDKSGRLIARRLGHVSRTVQFRLSAMSSRKIALASAKMVVK